MNELCRVALQVQCECDKRGWRFCFIGGLAVQYWGEPRFTRDVDLTLLTGFGGEEAYIDPFLKAFAPRIENCREFALQNRVLLLESSEGIGIDIALGALPFEEYAVNRAQLVEMEPGAILRLCSVEDLVVMKAFADRLQDQLDVQRIFERQGVRNLDWEYILHHLAPLCELKGAPEILKKLEKLKESLTEQGQ
ncbi:MAG: hypothetical protein EBS01_02520 [Verrucomicrobia bacterium]|nr:hypothetical protein [Verrucomicrobiota bacterium]